MNLTEFVLKLTGQADRLSATEQNLSTLADKLSAALATVESKDAEIATLNSRISELEAAAASAPSADKIVELESKITTLTTRAETAEAEVAALPEKVSAEAQRLLASQGHRPLNINPENDPSKEQKKPSGLTGRARLEADIEANLSKLNTAKK